MPLMDVGNLTVWHALKLYLPTSTTLTSVYRPPQAQLDFIVSKAREHGYVFQRNPSLGDESSWRGALEFIRGKSYKVAAPGRSVHQRGLAYDLAGPDLARIEMAVRKAVADGRITLLSGSRSALLVEAPPQNCVHVEIEAALLDFEPFDFA